MKRFNDFALRNASALFTSLVLTMLSVGAAFAQTTAFTYQGRFTDTSPNPPSSYAMTFKLYDSDGVQSAGNLIGIQSALVSVVDGVFTVKLDFGAAAFNTAQARYLEVQVGSTALTPRQEITSTPFSQRSLNAANADSLGGVAASNYLQTTGSGANLTNLNASNITSGTLNSARLGIVPVANGGTGSSSQNFVDLSSNQNVGGGKTFSGGVTVSSSNGLTMNDNFFRLRTSNDNNHGIIFNSTIDGPEFRAFTGFRWTNGANGATERMRLDGNGNLTVGGTISGTLATNSVGSSQVTDGSLRVTDIAVAVSAVSFPQFNVAAHSCATLQGNFSGVGAAAGDIVTLYPPNDMVPGFYIQPTTITNPAIVSFNVCNTLNTTYNFSPMSIRVVVMRP